MNANVSLMVNLPPDLAEAMRLKVEAGEYASAEDMLQAGIRNLLQRDDALEKWLREEVVVGHAEYLANTAQAMQADEVLPHLRARRSNSPTSRKSCGSSSRRAPSVILKTCTTTFATTPATASRTAMSVGSSHTAKD